MYPDHLPSNKDYERIISPAGGLLSAIFENDLLLLLPLSERICHTQRSNSLAGLRNCFSSSVTLGNLDTLNWVLFDFIPALEGLLRH
jgi:hypothetical protein